MLAAAREESLPGARDTFIGGRAPTGLVQAAKARTGIESDSELLVYALSKVAIEDDFGRKLVARKGCISQDIELGF